MSDHNLGNFERLPGELRTMIWKELRPKTKNAVSGDLGILRAGRQLSEEIMPSLYDSEILHFRVHHHIPEWLTIDNLRDAEWRIPNTRDPLYRVFANLPYQRLKCMRILINAIDAGSVAQLIYLSQNVRKLVELLEQSTGLPALEIHLLDATFAQWAKQDGTPRTTTSLNEDEEFIETDYRTILLPFCKLRNLPEVSIHVPEPLLAQRFTRFILKAIQRTLQRKTPYGSFKDPSGWPWDDSRIQNTLDTIYVELESQLDSLPGEAANMMRLERFVSWYDEDGNSKYFSEWERILHGQEITYEFEALQNRHDFLVSCNPLSVGMQRLRLQLGLYRFAKTDFHPARTFWDIESSRWYVFKVASLKYRYGRLLYDDLKIQSLLKSSWSAEEWRRYYPKGILPYSDVPEGDCFTFICSELGESDRHAEGMSASEKPRGFHRIRAQAALIDFSSGQRTKQAFDNVDGHLKGQRLEEFLKTLGYKKKVRELKDVE